MTTADKWHDAHRKVTVERSYGEVTLDAVSDAVEEGDSVQIDFNNAYDKRFNPENRYGGTVEWADPDPQSGGTVTLRATGTDYVVTVTAKGEVSLRRVDSDSQQSNSVGDLQGIYHWNPDE